MPLQSRYQLRPVPDPIPTEALIDGQWVLCLAALGVEEQRPDAGAKVGDGEVLFAHVTTCASGDAG